MTSTDRQLVYAVHWVDNSDICGDFLKSIFPTVKQVLEDTTHLMRRYMRTLMPDHPQNRMLCSALVGAKLAMHTMLQIVCMATVATPMLLSNIVTSLCYYTVPSLITCFDSYHCPF